MTDETQMRHGPLVRIALRRSGRRHLTEEEELLWSAVARGVKPLRPGKKVLPVPHARAAAAEVAPPPNLHKKIPPRAAIAAPHPRPAAAAPPLVLPRRERQQLARGRAAIDARIDLHGMTQAQAHSALLGFLHRAQQNGARFVLVITGKGFPDVARGERGVLRRQVPFWLALPDLRTCVLGFDVADISHGGEGAFYVRLRRG